jgi:hypothetical protein
MERKLFGVAIKWLLLAAVAIAVVGYVTSRFLFDNHGKVHQAQTNTRSAEAMQQAGADAVATVLNQADEEVSLHDLVGKASKEIDNAPNPAAARSATLGAACELRLYRDDPACAVRRADPAQVGRGGGGSAPADVHHP